MKRWLKRLAWLLAGLSTLVVILVAVAFNSDAALRWGIEQFGPDGLNVDDISGDLGGPITLVGLRYDTPALQLSVDRASVRWSLDRWYRPVVRIDDIELGNVRLVPGQSSTSEADEANTLTLPQPLDFGVDVIVDRVAIAQLSLNDGESTTLRRVLLQGSWMNGRLDVDRLRADVDEVGLSLTGHVDTADGYDHEFIALALERDRLPVEAVVEGNLAATRVTVEAPDYQSYLRADLESPLEDLSWTVDMRAGDLSRWAPVTNLRLRGDGALDALDFEGAALVDGRTVEVASSDLSWTATNINLGTVRVGLPDDGAIVDLTGQAELGAGGALDLQVDATYAARSAAATLTVTGPLDNYRVDGTFDVETRAISGELRGRGSTAGLEVQRLLLDAFEGRASLNAEVGWSEAVTWSASGTLEAFDPSAFAPDWPGSVSGLLSAQGDQNTFFVLVDEVSGTLRGRPLSGRVSARRDARNAVTVDADVSANRSRIQVSALLGNQNQATMQLDVADAADFWPGASGEADGDISLNWSDDEIGAAGKLSGSNLGWRDYSVGEVLVEARDDKAGDRVEINARNATLLDRKFSDVRASLAGSLAKHEGTWQVVSDKWSAEGDFGGRWESQRYRGELASLALRLQDFGEWTLAEPSRFRREASGRFALLPTCLSNRDEELCLGVDWGGDESNQLQFLGRQINLAPFAPLLSRTLGRDASLSGEFNGTVQMEQIARRWSTIDVNIEAAPGEIKVDGYEEAIGINALSLTADGDESKLVFRGDAQVDDTVIRMEGSADRPFDGGLVDARIVAELPDISAYAAIFPQVSALGGSISADVMLQGPADAITPRGTLFFEDLSASIDPLGVTWTGGEASLRWTGGAAADIAAQLSSGDGSIAVDGELAMVDGVPTAEIMITGQDFQAIDLTTVQGSISPNLRVLVGDDGVSVSGELGVPEAAIELVDFGQGVQASSDVVVVDDPARETNTGLPVTADVTVSLGDEVSLRGYGLDAALSGSLRVREAPDRPTLARGEIRVSGEYAAYGQQLSIERGRLLYTDTQIDDPGLDIRAARKLATVEAGVQVSGRVSRPQIEVYSIPSMEESEALSWLVLGRSLRSASDSGDTDVLAAAALSLGLKGGNRIASALNSSLGFAELGFSNRSELGGAAFSLGRYLSPKLYVSYSVGLLESLDLLELQYTLSDRWAVETQVGEEAKGILKYRVERGQ